MAEEDASVPAVIAGLGNPGAEYRATRHNLGFRVLDVLAERFGAGERRLDCNALVVHTDRAVLVWPQTYMNRSGYSLRCLAERMPIEPSNLLVVYDEISLPLGRLRLRGGGGPGGHRGMESVIRNMRTDDIPRLRLGIAPDTESDDDDLSEFVLSSFREDEIERVEEMTRRAADACESWLEAGIETTMNRFNR